MLRMLSSQAGTRVRNTLARAEEDVCNIHRVRCKRTGRVWSWQVGVGAKDEGYVPDLLIARQTPANSAVYASTPGWQPRTLSSAVQGIQHGPTESSTPV